MVGHLFYRQYPGLIIDFIFNGVLKKLISILPHFVLVKNILIIFTYYQIFN